MFELKVLNTDLFEIKFLVHYSGGKSDSKIN